MSAVVVGKNNTYGTIIMLHGLGDSGAGWQPIAEHFEKYFPLKWILPNAPSIAVTLNFGMEMPAWYDIYQLNTGAVQDAVGMGKSVKVVHDFIDKEIQAGVPPEKIFVGGFSQGGAVALLSGLRYSKQLGGILALSTYLPLYEKLKNEVFFFFFFLILKNSSFTHKKSSFQTLQKNTPIFMAHGEADQVIHLY